MRSAFIGKTLAALAVALFLSSPASAATGEDLIKIDGSSTVYPITEAVAEEFGSTNPKTKVTVGISGSGGGFKKFCAGETDLSNASRPIKEKERKLCEKNGIQFVEIPVAYDALSVVIHPDNTWATVMTPAQLKKMWEPAAQGKITKWNQIDPSWPNKELKLYGPGVDSGTFDYFTEAINGQSQASRGDFTSSEDDNVLVQGVVNDEGALGFFGLAYYIENKGRLKAVKVDNGNGPVAPNAENVENGTYEPLSRPLFVYVSKKALARPAVKNFMAFYLKNGPVLANEVGYVQLPRNIQSLVTARFNNATTGTMYSETTKGMGLADLLKRAS